MGSQREIAIEAVHLSKIFRDFWQRPKVRAVDDFNLTVYRGEVFGLLGPNGSGKSTAVKIMLGLLFPTSGNVAVLGRHPRNQKMKEMIGFLPEESYLYRYLNAEETLDFYGRLFNLSASRRQLRTERLLDMVGLTAHRRRALGEYSKGMARRIGLAQALINDPELLFLDEPTSGLDPIGNREIKDLILELKSRGKTVFVCSHLLADVEDVCDRIGIMYGGKLRVVGPVHELLKRRAITRIETPALTPEKVEQVVQCIRGGSAGIDVKVEQPLMRLEDYFLQVVEEARKEQPVSSGASAGRQPVSFWEEEEEEEVHGEALIESLVQTGEEAEAREKKPAAEELVLPESPRVRIEERKELISSLLGSRGEGAAETKMPEEAEALPERRPEGEMEREERRRQAQALIQQFVAPAAAKGEKPPAEEKDEEKDDEDDRRDDKQKP